MCFNPYYLESRDFQPVPCGKCVECRNRLVHSWAFRLCEEEKRCITSKFITLTYDSENVPVTRHGRESLWKRDCQLFFKRLRKAHTACGEVSPIKYFLCGEYGGQTVRPHYHCILFNASVKNIEKAWGLGSVHFRPVCRETIYYALKYVMTEPMTMKRNDSREREFRIMSKGLGEAYCARANNRAWHLADVEQRLYLNLTDGKKIGMPRYYKDKIYNEEQRERASYASLQKIRAVAEKRPVSEKQRVERLLAGYLAMAFEKKCRAAV